MPSTSSITPTLTENTPLQAECNFLNLDPLSQSIILKLLPTKDLISLGATSVRHHDVTDSELRKRKALKIYIGSNIPEERLESVIYRRIENVNNLLEELGNLEEDISRYTYYRFVDVTIDSSEIFKVLDNKLLFLNIIPTNSILSLSGFEIHEGATVALAKILKPGNNSFVKIGLNFLSCIILNLIFK